MPLISTLAAASARGFGEFNQRAGINYIENYFGTYLYSGTGAAQTITNNIGLLQTAAWESYKLTLSSINATGLDVDDSGNMYVCGRGGSPNTGFVLKLDSSGNIVWQTSLSSDLQLNAIKVGPDGSIYVCGATGVITGTNYRTYTVKLNSSGSVVWQRQFYLYSNQLSRGLSIAIDSSNNVYVGGNTFDSTGIYYYNSLIKYDSSGSLVWKKLIADFTASYQLCFVAVDATGNVIVASQNNNNVQYYTSLAKFNSSGTLLWQSEIDTVFPTGIVTDSSDNIYVSVYSSSNFGYIKFNSSGAIVLQKQIAISGTTFYPDATNGSIDIDSSGNIYVVANQSPSGYGEIVKFNTSGSLLFQFKLQDTTTSLYGIKAKSSDYLYVVGQSQSSGTNYGLISKLTTSGSTQAGTAFATLTLTTGTVSNFTFAVGGVGSSITNMSGTDAAGALTSSTASLTASRAIQDAAPGGMLWIKGRSGATNHAIYDSTRGIYFDIESNSTAAQTTQLQGVTNFSNTGFSIGTLAKINTNTAIYASWAFKQQSKFFDIVTYTGTGANTTITHGLGSVPGMIIVKRTDTTADWAVYHRSLANTEYLVLNTTAGKATGTTYWNSTTPTSTVFSLGTSTDVNANNGTYVAYLFAHDAGGFGLNGTDSVISCGTFTTNAGGTATVNLGWEPQWILWKYTNSAGPGWEMNDIARGAPVNDVEARLNANSSGAETGAVMAWPTATGFDVGAGVTQSNGTYIYVAIRRGPMAVPTDATKVFQPTVYTGTNVDNRLVNTTIAPDMVWARQRNSTTVGGMVVGDRLRGQPYLLTGTTGAEVNDADSFDQQIVSTTEYGTAFSSMSGVWVGNDATSQLNASTTASNQIIEAFKRAPGFFDVVTYTGTGANTTISHNLNAVPELMLIKRRASTNAWAVYSAGIANTEYLVLNTTAGKASGSTYWNSTTPTSTVFSLGTSADVNTSTATYVAYLFATCPGVSKVGTYTGTGTTNQINCGFTSGARFVLIKRTDSTGDWYVYDTARGIIAANDPYILLNSTAAEVTNTDYVDPYSLGFELSSTAPAGLNANGGTYIFLAIA